MANYNLTQTGAQVQALLDAVASGYVFLGTATPTTTPDTTNPGVCYLATQEGTYTNFGSATIDAGYIAVLCWNGSTWTIKTASVVLANDSIMGKQINGNAQVVGSTPITLSFIDGSYKSQSGTTSISTVTNASWSTAIIEDVVAGDVIDLTLPAAVDVANYPNYFIFAVNSTTAAISRTTIANYVELLDNTTHTYRLTVPSGTVLIYSSCKTANKSSISASKQTTKKNLQWLDVKASNLNSDVADVINDDVYSYSAQYRLWNSIKRPITFASKRLVAFGDSITAGVTSPNLAVITDSYIKLFCDWAGVTTRWDRAISGSTIVPRGNGNDIYDKVLAFTNAIDIVVIAGGTNDWNTGQPIGTFADTATTTVYGALKGICAYLQTTYPDAVVIFITPIPYTKPASMYPNHIAPLDAYRTAIYDVATSYGYNVVSGLDLGMPREPGGWNNSIVADSDGLHPTAAGHALYARGLCGKLL